MRERIRGLTQSAANYRESAEHADSRSGYSQDRAEASRCETMAAGVRMEYQTWFARQTAPRCPQCCELLDLATAGERMREHPGDGPGGIVESIDCPCGHAYLAKPTVVIHWQTEGAIDGP
jgi:hypothetical protein